MNFDPESAKLTEEIRHDIDRTRERMDQTIDALVERFKGRHLVDEAIGFFRTKSDTSPETISKIKDNVVKSASSVANSIASTVKENPLPLALVGAGVAWMIYSGVRARQEAREGEDLSDYRVRPSYMRSEYEESGYELSGGGYGSSGYTPADYQEELSTEFAGEPSGHEQSGSGLVEKAGDAAHGLADKASHAVHELKERATRLREKLGEGAHAVRERAGEVQDRTRRAYRASREQIVDTTREHPVEVGLGLLLAGVVVGLALPTPRKVNQVVGARADRLRQRAREMSRQLAHRGAEIARAAAEAARKDAEKQPAQAQPTQAPLTATSLPPSESVRQEGMLNPNTTPAERSQSAASI
ncbi:MAG TPA: DUF3618 domain-containing protein [Opitutaceae bacterium]|nr:DUF3618 domain-containing protein [Opitutaceae bacterium]